MFPFKKKELLPAGCQERVVEAIRQAELKTSGEIRIFIESRCAYVNALDRAHEVFFQLGMEQTINRNAVLVYMAIDDHQFAILGDEQIYRIAGGKDFWNTAADHLRTYLRKDQLTEGLVECIREIADLMCVYYPYDPSVDKNELPDEIVFGK